jgi:hypothetical protein
MWATTETAFAVSTFSKTLNQNFEPLVLSSGKNYWLSAHTHVQTIPPPERFIVGGLMADKYFTGLNIGSTTDYRASVAIVEQYRPGRNNRLDNLVGFREIPICEPNQSLLTLVPQAVGEYGRQHASDPTFQILIPTMNEWLKEQRKQSGILSDIGSLLPVLSSEQKTKVQTDCYWFDTGATILGLNRKYTEDAWQDQHTNASTEHLKKFIEQFVSRTGSNREEVYAFLGLIAGVYEKGLLVGKFDLSPQRFEALCKNPE